MKKYSLIGISIVTVVVLILVSLSNVVGFQTVQSSNKQIINETVNQRELLFQTIVDIANNKEVQKTILDNQGKFHNLLSSTPIDLIPTITKKQLNLTYYFGVVLSKTTGKARLTSLTREHPVMSVQTKEKMDSIIGGNLKLNKEMAQLSILNCPSCSESRINWTFPIICTLLFPLYFVCFFIALIKAIFGHSVFYPIIIISYIGEILNCRWAYSD